MHGVIVWKPNNQKRPRILIFTALIFIIMANLNYFTNKTLKRNNELQSSQYIGLFI